MRKPYGLPLVSAAAGGVSAAATACDAAGPQCQERAVGTATVGRSDPPARGRTARGALCRGIRGRARGLARAAGLRAVATTRTSQHGVPRVRRVISRRSTITVSTCTATPVAAGGGVRRRCSCRPVRPSYGHPSLCSRCNVPAAACCLTAAAPTAPRPAIGVYTPFAVGEAVARTECTQLFPWHRGAGRQTPIPLMRCGDMHTSHSHLPSPASRQSPHPIWVPTSFVLGRDCRPPSHTTSCAA